MITLGIDTSAIYASVALAEDGELLAEQFVRGRQNHSAVLLPMLENMLRYTGIAIGGICRIAVTAGPGSFTGVRIGVSAAKGLAHGLQLPCAGVSTLASMAALSHTLPGTLCCTMDARREQVYAALFRGQEKRGAGQDLEIGLGGSRKSEIKNQRPKPCLLGSSLDGKDILPPERLTLDMVLPITELEQRLPEDDTVFFLGDGAVLCHQLMRQRPNWQLAPPHLRCQRAYGAILAAREEEYHPPAALKAIYLRPSQAERERENKA